MEAETAAREGDRADDWSTKQQDENQLRQSQDDIGREVNPRQVGCGDKAACEEGVERKGLMRKECEGAERVLDRVGLRPGPE
jgi:hypothetical protein